jgi:hypothetical protein
MVNGAPSAKLHRALKAWIHQLVDVVEGDGRSIFVGRHLILVHSRSLHPVTPVIDQLTASVAKARQRPCESEKLAMESFWCRKRTERERSQSQLRNATAF